MLRKKHYEAIAQAIHDEIRPYDERAVGSMVHNIIDNLADYFEQENPRFDRERFLDACGIEPNIARRQ